MTMTTAAATVLKALRLPAAKVHGAAVAAGCATALEEADGLDPVNDGQEGAA